MILLLSASVKCHQQPNTSRLKYINMHLNLHYAVSPHLREILGRLVTTCTLPLLLASQSSGLDIQLHEVNLLRKIKLLTRVEFEIL